MRKLFFIYTSLILMLSGCGGNGPDMDDFNLDVYSPDYASGFRILGADGYKSTLLEVSVPWQGAGSASSKPVFIRRNDEPVPNGFDGSVIDGDAQRVVCMSSSHVAMLNAIGALERVVGASGVRFLWNERADSLVEVGYDQYVDYESLVSLNPDVVFLYGITGESPLETKLRELGIPYAYIGEYVEDSPLGKAEWLVAAAEIVGLRAEGVDVFEDIPSRYNAVKEKIAKFATSRPKVMLNTPYGESWFMPGSKSYMVRLVEDACGEYIYKGNDTNRSEPISFEEAAVFTAKADFWLNASAESIDELSDRYPKFADVQSVISGKVYNCDCRSSVSGGNDFWESGVIMPDVVLYDLGVILHPGFGSELYFYRQLQ